jgi:hypothetical protein
VSFTVYVDLNLLDKLDVEAGMASASTIESASGSAVPSGSAKVELKIAADGGAGMTGAGVYTTTQVDVVTVTVAPTSGGCVVGNGSVVDGYVAASSRIGNGNGNGNGTVLSSEGDGGPELRWGIGGVLGVLGFAFWVL